MCKAFQLLIIVLALAGAALADDFSTFRGAWFEIKYPTAFEAVPRDPGATSVDMGPDGASFISPDKLVEFYIYSPQWSGKSQWQTKRPGEKTLSYSRQWEGNKRITYVTVLGNGYTRSWALTEQPSLNTSWVFGFKYNNQAAYQRYRPQYLRFKQSLQQFAD